MKRCYFESFKFIFPTKPHTFYGVWFRGNYEITYASLEKDDDSETMENLEK